MRFLILLFFFLYGFIQAQSPYDISLKKEGIILGGSFGFAVTSYFIDLNTDVLTQNEIANLDANLIFQPDRPFASNYSKKWDKGSDVSLILNSLLPMTLLASTQGRNKYKEIALLYGETVALNGSLTLMIKSISKRIRPFVYNENVDVSEKLKTKSKKSFISGHTSQSAALAFLTAKIFSDFNPESKFRNLVWSGAVLLPMVSAYSRVQAGQHFPTDVIAGYIVGAGVGMLIPTLHKRSTFTFSNIDFHVLPGNFSIVWNMN